jgi:hypothetical protein
VSAEGRGGFGFIPFEGERKICIGGSLEKREKIKALRAENYTRALRGVWSM